MLGVSVVLRWAGEPVTAISRQSKSEELTCLKHGPKFLATHFNANIAWLLEDILHFRCHFESAMTWRVMVYQIIMVLVRT